MSERERRKERGGKREEERERRKERGEEREEERERRRERGGEIEEEREERVRFYVKKKTTTTRTFQLISRSFGRRQ